jgi:hypothetical protein
VKKRKNNPYVNLSLEQVKRAESLFYYVQIGNETPPFNGKFTYSKEVAESIFWQMRDSLEAMKKEGSRKEKRDAKYCLRNFRVIPLRIH